MTYIRLSRVPKCQSGRTEIMKNKTLHSLDRTERTMVRWMCGVALRDRKRIEICTVFWVFRLQNMVNVLRHDRLRCFGHIEHKSEEDWVSAACRNMEVVGENEEEGAGRLGGNV